MNLSLSLCCSCWMTLNELNLLHQMHCQSFSENIETNFLLVKVLRYVYFRFTYPRRSLANLWSKHAWWSKMPKDDHLDYMWSSRESTPRLLLKHVKSAMKFQCISLEENQTPYELHAFKIIQAKQARVYQVCYGSYGFDRARLSLGTKETKTKLQRIHTQHPKCPFYNHSDHQSASIRELGTIRLRCTLSMVV